MSPPKRRNGGPGQGTAAVIAATAERLDPHQDTPEGCQERAQRDYIVVRADAYPPSGRRRMWLLLVKSCPFCGGYSHAHRGSARGGLREAGCRRGDYLVRPALSGQVAA